MSYVNAKKNNWKIDKLKFNIIHTLDGAIENYDEILRVLTPESVMAARPGDLLAIELFYDMSVLVEDPAVEPYLEQLASFPREGEQQVGIYRRVNP